jgi:hypothetical protein
MSEQNLSLSIKVNTETGALEVLGTKLKDVAAQAKGADRYLSGLGSTSKELLSAFGLVATGAGILQFFKNAVTEANADAEALRRLSFALSANGVDWAKSKDGVMAWSEGMQETTRFSNTQALEALGKLSKATKDVGQAQEAVKVAMGLSVASGMDLNQALDLMQGLMMGNQRAVMMAHRELGTFVGNAKTAQEMVDALSAKVGGAAQSEESFSKSSAQLTNAWDDFSKQVGNAFIPALTSIVNALTFIMARVEDLGTIIAAFAVSTAAIFQGLGLAIKDAMTGHFREAANDIRMMNGQIVSIAEGTKDQIIGLENKKTAAIQAAAAKHIQIKTQESIQDMTKAKEQAAKIIEIDAELHKKIDALGVQTLKKKMDALDFEVAAKAAAINKEIEDSKQKTILLVELDRYKATAAVQLSRDEAKMKRDVGFQVAENALEALAIVNNMGEKDSQAQVNRAIMIMALEKAIAIARIWSAPSTGNIYADIALKASQTALATAQFAQQSQAITQAAKTARTQGGETAAQFSQIQIPGGDFVQTGLPGFTPVGVPGESFSGTSPLQPSFAGAPSGGSGQTVNVTIPQITINVAVDTLEVADRRKILQALADEIRGASVEAIRFAVTSANLAETNSKVAV